MSKIQYKSQWRIQDFLEGEGQLPKEVRQPIILQHFCQEPHENDRIWPERGRTSLSPLLDPPLKVDIKMSPIDI